MHPVFRPYTARCVRKQLQARMCKLGGACMHACVCVCVCVRMQVYAAVWRDAPAAAAAVLAAASSGPAAAAAAAAGGAVDLTVAVKVVPLMIDSASYNARSLDSLKQEIQVRVRSFGISHTCSSRLHTLTYTS